MAATGLQAEPDPKQIDADAANFHKFRIDVLANTNQTRSRDHSAVMKHIFDECGKLARRTSPDYIYGMVTDLIRDNSRTEEPYLIAIMVLDQYPPDPARTVVKKIIANPKYKACDDVKNWLWEIDQAQKGENPSSL